MSQWKTKERKEVWAEFDLGYDGDSYLTRHCPFNMKKGPGKLERYNKEHKCHCRNSAVSHYDRIFYNGGGMYSSIEVCSNCHLLASGGDY
jgi:hypothetical protein